MYRIVGESIANYIHQVAQFPYADAGGMYIYRIYVQKQWNIRVTQRYYMWYGPGAKKWWRVISELYNRPMQEGSLAFCCTLAIQQTL